jgi:DNA-binding transcriptional regulator YdaS (Cro superfamily)
VQKRGRLTISEKLSAVQQRLRTGDQTAIASMTGYHITHVNRVLKGRRGNPSGVIVQAAYSLVGKRKVNA